MSFIENKSGASYASGWFLADANCTRLTRNFKPEDSTNIEIKDGPNGTKYVPMGSVYKDEGTAAGIVYEDVDITNGAAAGSIVTEGTVYKDRLTTTAQGSVTEITTITVIEATPKVTRSGE